MTSYTVNRYINDYEGDLIFWSNCCGDLHHNGEYDINDEKELPAELRAAYKEFTEDLGVNFYLAEFEGNYGILLGAEVDECYARDVGLTYDELLNEAYQRAVECAKEYPKYKVIFGENTRQWSDGSVTSDLMIFLPWYTPGREIKEVGEFMEKTCYSISPGQNKDRTLEELDTDMKISGVILEDGDGGILFLDNLSLSKEDEAAVWNILNKYAYKERVVEDMQKETMEDYFR